MVYKYWMTNMTKWPFDKHKKMSMLSTHVRQRHILLQCIVPCLPITQGSQGSEARVYRGESSPSILLATKPPGTSAGGASLSIPSRRRAILSFLWPDARQRAKVKRCWTGFVLMKLFRRVKTQRSEPWHYLFIPKSSGTGPSKYFFNSETEC